MKVKEFYEEIHGDYNDIMSRLMKEERIERFVLKLLEKDSLNELKEKIDEALASEETKYYTVITFDRDYA